MTPQTATAMQSPKTSTVLIQRQNEYVIERIEQAYDSIAKRAFEIFDNNGRWFGNELSDWLQAESELFHPVHLEIAETEQALTVRAEVPRFAARELDVYLEGNRLIIAGKHESREESKRGKTIYSERCANEILRSVDLPSGVDGSKANAMLNDGILHIELPKAGPAKSVRIETKPAS
jgi:HSP20 family molecular chaperone IbpA